MLKVKEMTVKESKEAKGMSEIHIIYEDGMIMTIPCGLVLFENMVENKEVPVKVSSIQFKIDMYPNKDEDKPFVIE